MVPPARSSSVGICLILVSELSFLDRVLGISRQPELRILDIGAGYGRLAYRAVSALDNISAYYCVDAIARSTFLCEYYLDKKGVANRAITISLDEQDRLPANGAITIAINIHSFSECSAAAVNYWIGRCAALGIPYLFLVPNDSGSGGDALRFTVGNGDYRGLIEAHGYRLCHSEPKYENSQIQRYSAVRAWYYLFERREIPASGGF